MREKERLLPEYTIRNLTLDDCAAIPKFIESNSSMKPHGMEVYRLMARGFSNTCLVVESEGQIGGIMFGLVVDRNPEVFFMWYLILSPSLRKPRLFSDLFHRTLKMAQGSECKKFEFTLYDGIPESKRLLRYARRVLGDDFKSRPFLNDPAEIAPETLYEFPLPQ